MAQNSKPAGPRFSVFGPNGKTLGKAVHGGKHWWTQRVLTIVGLPLVIASIITIACGAGGGAERMFTMLAKPWATILIGLTSFLMIAHMRFGLQQIFEDYVPTRKTRYTLFILNDAFCALVALMIAYAMFKFSAVSLMMHN